MARLRQCKYCGHWINPEFGADDPAEHAMRPGTREDPRAPGDRDDVCDMCDYGREVRKKERGEPTK